MNNHEQHETRRMGTTMTMLAWVLALALVAWWFAGYEEERYNPNQQVNTATLADGSQAVVLQRNPYGHYVATGSINGQPVTFLLDTGASDISIPAGLADRLGLERGISQVYNTANGPIRAYLTKLDRVSLGSIELRDVRASINPVDNDNEILLGMSFLRDLDFSQRGDTLTIRPRH